MIKYSGTVSNSSWPFVSYINPGKTFITSMYSSANKLRLPMLAGILFAFFWGSGSTITKLGLQYLQPWVLAVCRLMTAAIIMLIIAHLILRYPLPKRKYWKSIFIYGLLNLSIFLGMYNYALQFLPGGIGTLMTSTIPIFITLFTGLWLKKKISAIIIICLIICLAGVIIAAWPIIHFTKQSVIGMLIMLVGIVSNASGAVYFVGKDWEGLNLLTINGWQTLIGGLLLVPFCFYNYHQNDNHFTLSAFICIGWLAIFISISAILLWLFILKQNPIKAAFWLFLCPIIGFGLAAFLLHEPLSWYTAIGLSFVISGLYLGQKNA